MKLKHFYFLTLCFCSFLQIDQYKATVVRVLDGDTIEVLYKGKTEKIRLFGVDCPEISHKQGEPSQPFGQKAKDFTKLLTTESKGSVTIIVTGTDLYRRTIAYVILEDGRNLNEELLQNGLAWHYTKYDKTRTWQDMQKAAQIAKLGLWSDSIPQAPWDYRHSN
jgi:endonuclease YncB( thermonuclease family)